MSANEALSEVNDNPIFDSPNISSGDAEAESAQEEMTEEQRIQKERETVEIDGVPLSKEEIEYKSTDIRKKGRTNYFVNVEGEEERARAAAKKANAEREAEKRRNRDIEAAAAKQRRAEEDEANKELIEEKKRANEVDKYIKKQRKKAQKTPKTNGRQRTASRKTLFAIISAVFILAIICLAAFVIIPAMQSNPDEPDEQQKREEDEKYFAEFYSNPLNAALRDLNDNAGLAEALDNYYYEDVDAIYEEAGKDIMDECEQVGLYLDKANRIYQRDKNEIAEIKKALDYASEIQCTDVSVLNDLKGYYEMIGDYSRADEIEVKIKMYIPISSPEPNQTNSDDPDYDKSEDA